MIKTTWGKQSLILGILVILFCTFIAMPVLAGDGDGSGGGQNVPLGLASSNPFNGQQGVFSTAEIKLTFNKNVINMTVIDNNKKCFSLTSASGKQIPIEVIMADDQINPELKREVGIKPLQTLESGTTYTLNIDGKLQAKSGAALGNDVKVSFTTAASKKTEEVSKGTTNVIPPKDVPKTVDSTVTSNRIKPANSNVKTEQQKTEKREVEATTEKDTKTETKAVAEQKTLDGGGVPWLIVVLVIAVIVGASYAYYFKRK